jgi:septum formation protein
LEKPENEADAVSMLQRLSGSWHRVHTGVVIYVDKQQAAEFNIATEVKFCPLTPADIQAYLSFGESWDKAGAYAIQGIGGQMISELKGCYFNVMGLPISALSTVVAHLHAGGRIGNIVPHA